MNERFELEYSTDYGSTTGKMKINPERFFTTTKANMKKLDKVVQLDWMKRDTFWKDAVEAIRTDTTHYIDGQIEAYERIAEQATDKKEKKEARAVANAYKRDKKKLKGNIEFIEQNFIERK